MSSTQKIAKTFSFEERFRDRLTFSDATKIRLSSDVPSAPKLQLKVQSYNKVTGTAVYPTDTDLTVTTRVENPLALQSLAGFDPYPRDADQPTGTAVKYKINDGTNNRFWNGATWAIAGATDWNTALEVATNIASYPTTSKQFGLVINLVTTDTTVTPTLSYVDLLMVCNVDYIRSILSDALGASLKTGIRASLDFGLSAPGGNKFNLRDLETPYNIVSVAEVYNHTSDPNHTTNLFSAYSSVDKVVTMTGSVDRGNAIWVTLLIEPELYVNWPSQDYIEVEKLPAVVIEQVELTGQRIRARQIVKNAATNQASVRDEPFRLRIDCTIRLVAEKNRSLMSMMDRALTHASNTPLLTWPAVDEELTLMTDAEGVFRNRPNLSDKHEATYSAVLLDVNLFFGDEVTYNLIQQFNLTATSPKLEGGASWTGTK